MPTLQRWDVKKYQMLRKQTAVNQEGNAVKQGWGCYDLNFESDDPSFYATLNMLDKPGSIAASNSSNFSIVGILFPFS